MILAFKFKTHKFNTSWKPINKRIANKIEVILTPNTLNIVGHYNYKKP